jgi:hypothetical protein
MAYAIKQLEWHLVRGFMGNKWRAAALGLEWEIPEYDTRLEQRKEVAQLEFRSQVLRYIESVTPDAPPREDTDEVSKRYKDAWEQVFGSTPFFNVLEIAEGGLDYLPMLKPAAATVLSLSPIVHVDDKGKATIVERSPKQIVIDHLIREHKDVSEEYRMAAHNGQVGLTQQLLPRLKSLESALAIAVKDADVAPAQQKEQKNG